MSTWRALCSHHRLGLGCLAVCFALLANPLLSPADEPNEPAPAVGQPTTEPVETQTQPASTGTDTSSHRLKSKWFFGQDGNNPGLGDPGGILGQILAALLVVAVLGAAAYLVFKRMGLRPGAARSGRRIRIVETSYLAPKRTLHLVEVQGRALLLASTPDRVSLLSELAPGQSQASDKTDKTKESPEAK